MKIVYGTEPYCIDHEVRKLAENTTYYVQVFDAIDGVKEFLQSISFFGIPCAIYKVEDVKKERKELLHLMEECPESSCLIIRTEKLDNSKDWNAWKSKHGICCDKLNGKSYQCWIQKAFQSLDCPIAEPMLRYFIDRSAYAYQERRDGKDETIDLYQIAIFIKQIAFASMDAGVSKETIDQVVPAAVGKSWELASKLLLDPMEGMKLAVELFDHGNNSLKLYGMLLRNYRVAKKALLLSDMKENEILKLLGLTEKQMRGIRAYRKLPEERLDTVMSILIEAMNRTKISFGNERNLFIQTMAKLIMDFSLLSPLEFFVVPKNGDGRNNKPPAMRVRVDCYTKNHLSVYNRVVQAVLQKGKVIYGEERKFTCAYEMDVQISYRLHT